MKPGKNHYHKGKNNGLRDNKKIKRNTSDLLFILPPTHSL